MASGSAKDGASMSSLLDEATSLFPEDLHGEGYHTCVLEPGELGMHADWQNGRVESIDAVGQARRLKVQAGWQFHTIEGAPYSEQRLDRYIAGSMNYTVVFKDPSHPAFDSLSEVPSEPYVPKLEAKPPEPESAEEHPPEEVLKQVPPQRSFHTPLDQLNRESESQSQSDHDKVLVEASGAAAASSMLVPNDAELEVTLSSLLESTGKSTGSGASLPGPTDLSGPKHQEQRQQEQKQEYGQSRLSNFMQYELDSYDTRYELDTSAVYNESRFPNDTSTSVVVVADDPRSPLVDKDVASSAVIDEERPKLPWLVVEYCSLVKRWPVSLFLLYLGLIGLLIGLLWRELEISTDFSDFVRVDGDALRQMDAFLLALEDQKGPNDRRRLEDLQEPISASMNSTDDVTRYPIRSHRRLQAMTVMEKFFAVIYKAREGDIFDGRAIGEVRDLEMHLRNLPLWREICGQLVNAQLRYFCDPGNSFAAFAWPTTAAAVPANAARGVDFEVQFNGQGTEQFDAPALLAYMQ
jgi:hypothetical protein